LSWATGVLAHRPPSRSQPRPRDRDRRVSGERRHAEESGAADESRQRAHDPTLSPPARV